jgi:hypothetical protein
VSLILEALRKLDREKDAPQKGFLVLGTLTPPPRTSRRIVLGAVAGAATLALIGAAVLAPRLAAPPSPAPSVEPTGAGNLTPASRPAETAPVPDPRLELEQPRSPRPPSPARPEATATPPSGAPMPGASSAPSAGTHVEASPSGPQFEALVLEAVGERDGQRIAVLSGRLVREGDVIGGTRVLRIGASEVEIETAGERRVLRF